MSRLPDHAAAVAYIEDLLNRDFRESGYNPKEGYWWGRSAAGGDTYRFTIEP